MTKDSAEKRVTDSKSITEKARRKADGEDSLQQSGAKRIAKTKEAVATVNVISGFHRDGDWHLKSYDVRREVRAGEADWSSIPPL